MGPDVATQRVLDDHARTLGAHPSHEEHDPGTSVGIGALKDKHSRLGYNYKVKIEIGLMKRPKEIVRVLFVLIERTSSNPTAIDAAMPVDLKGLLP